MAKKKTPSLGGYSQDDYMALLDAVAALAMGVDGNTMRRTRSRAASSGMKKFTSKVTYQLKVKLRGVTKPPVWRRLLVPSQCSFSTFHIILQDAFGWFNEHLYQFGDTPYSSTLQIFEPNEATIEPPTHDASKYTLGDYFRKGTKSKKLVYVYDFGDDWIHDIVLEEVIDEQSDKASCIAGKGTCPDEDCGGPWGYADLKDSGEVEDPVWFDLPSANELVQRIKI